MTSQIWGTTTYFGLGNSTRTCSKMFFLLVPTPQVHVFISLRFEVNILFPRIFEKRTTGFACEVLKKQWKPFFGEQATLTRRRSKLDEGGTKIRDYSKHWCQVYFRIYNRDLQNSLPDSVVKQSKNAHDTKERKLCRLLFCRVLRHWKCTPSLSLDPQQMRSNTLIWILMIKCALRYLCCFCFWFARLRSSSVRAMISYF